MEILGTKFRPFFAQVLEQKSHGFPQSALNAKSN
jgi:hypothetical protein